jgi:hypothetical protein
MDLCLLDKHVINSNDTKLTTLSCSSTPTALFLDVSALDVVPLVEEGS